jgi:serine/threonine protein kinase
MIYNIEHDGIIIYEVKKEPFRSDEFEIHAFDDLRLIDDYILPLGSARTTNASSAFSDDFIPAEKMKNNITPDDFDYIKVIGKGYFGKVTQARFKKDGCLYAVKALKKSKLKEEKHIEHTQTERKIMEFVSHPFIVSLKFAFQTEKKLYFVMDCYEGGELFYHLRNKGRFSENQAKFYMAQITLAIEFLHGKKIIYRDLKPENIVLDSRGYIKITDFGLAKENISDESLTQTFCGTPEYLAPEIIRGDKYGKGVDLWCMGILLFEILYGFVYISNIATIL